MYDLETTQYSIDRDVGYCSARHGEFKLVYDVETAQFLIGRHRVLQCEAWGAQCSV